MFRRFLRARFARALVSCGSQQLAVSTLNNAMRHGRAPFDSNDL